VLAAVAVLVGCGSEQRPAPGPPAVRAVGDARLPGRLWLLAGPNVLNADLYEATGTLSHLRRRTVNGRVSMVAVRDGLVVVSDARGRGYDRVEVPDLRRRGDALPGRLIADDGQGPQFGRRGRLLFEAPQWDSRGDVKATDVFVADPPAFRPRRALRAKGSGAWAAWGPDDRIALAFDRDHRARLNAGGEDERVVKTPLRRLQALKGAGDGVLFAFEYPLAKRAVMIRDGRAELLPAGWVPDQSLGDGSVVLVISADRRRLGLMDARTKRVTQLGTVTSGVINAAAIDDEERR